MEKAKQLIFVTVLLNRAAFLAGKLTVKRLQWSVRQRLEARGAPSYSLGSMLALTQARTVPRGFRLEPWMTQCCRATKTQACSFYRRYCPQGAGTRQKCSAGHSRFFLTYKTGFLYWQWPFNKISRWPIFFL